MRKVKNNQIFIYIGIISILITTVLIGLLMSGVIFYLKDGMSYIANNTDQYTLSHTTLNENYEFEVNLDHLDENKGKVVYNDGDNKIIISDIDTDGHSYRISFRSIGEHSFNEATLVSGIRHSFDSNRGFSSTLSANMLVEYDGTQTQASKFGVSGINYKDGDTFGFYVMNLSDYDGGSVKITLTNLSLHKWTKN